METKSLTTYYLKVFFCYLSLWSRYIRYTKHLEKPTTAFLL